MAKGCDYSWARPPMSALQAAGITFACRYLSYDKTGKNLTAGEANALQGAGIRVVSNWEWGTHDTLSGAGLGAQHARDAASMHAAVGGPADAPIYFSIDFDAQAGDMHAVTAYFDAAVGVLGHDRVGVYGGFYPVQVLSARDTCHYYWQTYAWSNGQWSGAAQLRQIQNGVLISGFDADIDQSIGDLYGAWGQPLAQQGLGVISAGPWDPTGAILAVGDGLWSLTNGINAYTASIRNLQNY